jgi:RNA polymerase sigma-70 factor (ECF subfamily)
VSQRAGATTDEAAAFVALCADDRAFSTWYDVALPRVYGFVHGRTGGDPTLSEDITAEAFLEAVRARASFDGRSDPITWVCAIARNRLIDHYRSEARDRARHLRLITTESLSTDRAWDHVDERDLVLSSLAGLSAIDRTALVLRYLDGYSVRETARLIGRSEAATESLLVRARDRVRTSLAGGRE